MRARCKCQTCCPWLACHARVCSSNRAARVAVHNAPQSGTRAITAHTHHTLVALWQQPPNPLPAAYQRLSAALLQPHRQVFCFNTCAQPLLQAATTHHFGGTFSRSQPPFQVKSLKATEGNGKSDSPRAVTL